LRYILDRVIGQPTGGGGCVDGEFKTSYVPVVQMMAAEIEYGMDDNLWMLYGSSFCDEAFL
jgi:hypothetical protein